VRESAAPVAPAPVTTFTTPGHARLVAQFGKRRAERPASSAGFSTTAQPVASTGPTFHTALNSGPFHG
jgi:hypothetical protein